MSSGSVKDLLKTISSCVTKATVPLPDDLLQVIQIFLDKHETIEDSDSQRLHEELQAIYHKEISKKPNRYSFFLAVLRNLRPALKGRRILEWWDLLYLNIFDSLTREKGLANEAQSILLEILVYDEDNTEAAKISEALFKKLVKLWLDNGRAPTTEDQAIVQATHMVRRQIQYVLISFGRKRTKEFLTAMNELFVQKIYRLQVLPLLCKFIQTQPPRLHDLLQTELFKNLLRCLTIDTSTTVVSLALSALVMFLPHIPWSMSAKGHLPSLFNIYSRLLFWDRYCNSGPQDESSVSQLEKAPDFYNETSKEDASWEKISYSLETDDSKVPELLLYFTFLYGLYPINFMDYVRKPKRYLRHANYPGADKVDIEPLEIRQRSEPLRQLHLLHPNFFNMTIESELVDANRFLTIDAPDIITDCMALCTPMYAIVDNSVVIPESQDFYPLDQSDNDIPDIPLLDRLEDGATEGDSRGVDWQDAINTVAQPQYENNGTSELMSKTSITNTSSNNFESPLLVPQQDSPTLGANIRVPGSRTSLQEMLISQKSLRGSSYQSLPDSSSHPLASSTLNQEKISSVDHQLSLETQSVHARSPSLQPLASSSGDYVASLQREIMLLKNDLNFERYLKQQHLSHIGQLRRKHVKEAVVEAETQQLINSNRSLKNKLEEAKKTNVQIKREAEKSRSHLKKWEADLTSKLRTLRGEQKRWSTEGEILRRDLELSQENCKKLRQLVVDGEAKELLSKQQVESMKYLVEENERLQLDLQNHAVLLRQFEISRNEKDLAKETEAVAWRQVDLLNTKLQARDAEIEEAKKYYSAQIEDLRLKLEEASTDPRKKQLKNFQKMVETALAASRAKISEVHQEQTKLLKRYSKLEYKYLKLQEQQSLDQPLPSQDFNNTRSFDQFVTGHSNAFIQRTHAMSDPESEPFLQSPSPTGPLTLSSSYPERPSYGHVSSQSPPSPLSSHARTFPDHRNPVTHDTSTRTGDNLKGSQSSSEIDNKVQPHNENRVYPRGGIQNVGRPRKEKKTFDSDGGEASGSDRKDKKKKSGGGGGLKGIRGFV